MAHVNPSLFERLENATSLLVSGGTLVAQSISSVAPIFFGIQAMKTLLLQTFVTTF